MKGPLDIFKSIFVPASRRSDDGREVWPSRASFILAAMGGCVGIGNLLRYPSQVFNNFGLQWFVPYILAIIFLGVPALVLEITIGQAYRGGPTFAFDHMHKRLKGVGFSLVFNGHMIVLYYVAILAWAMSYLRNSVKSPVPWQGDPETFYMESVIRNVAPEVVENGSYMTYPGTAIIGETAGWLVFTWFLVWLCIWRGVGLTGRVVYFTMGIPIVTIFILMVRGVSLPNAARGVRYAWGTWRSETLANGKIYQDAVGQVFFSIGVGMGYYTSYASYNNQYQNGVQDALIIVVSNSMIEFMASFAVFGVVGFLDMDPYTADPLGSFSVAFLTLPAATAEMPGSQFWSFLLFTTIMVLGFSSAFALTDVTVNLICDSNFGKTWRREYVSTIVVIVSLLLSLIYATEFGYYMLDAADTWLNNFCLVWTVLCECLGATMIYRYKDVVGLVGMPAYLAYTFTYIASLAVGVGVAHAVMPEAGAGVGFGIFILGTLASLVVAKRPESQPPRFWKRDVWLEKAYYLMFYQGYQLSLDLNLVVATGKNWSIPSSWGFILRYITSPILAIILGFAYPAFSTRRADPLQILWFSLGHLVMVFVAVGFIWPRYFDMFIPVEKRGEGRIPFKPNVAVAVVDVYSGRAIEEGDAAGEMRQRRSVEEKRTGKGNSDSEDGVAENKPADNRRTEVY